MVKWFAGKWKWALVGVASCATGSSCLLYFEIENLKKNLHPSLSVLDREKYRSYIYIRPEQFDLLNSHHWNEKGLQHLYSEIETYIINHIPPSIAKHLPIKLLKGRELQAQRYLSPWQLLKEASTPSSNIAQDVIDKINNHKWMDDDSENEDENFLDEYEYRLLGQNLDPLYLYALARTKGVDKRFFVAPRPLPTLKDDSAIEYMLYDMLLKLPSHDVESCLRFFTHGALSISDERQLKKGGRWCFAGNGLNYAREIVSQEKVESFCLQALVKHSKIPDHCEAMIDLGVLDMLQRILNDRPNALKNQRNAVRIISNICVNENLHPRILKSGWLSTLVQLSNSKLLHLRMQASRALANLDRKNVEEKYVDGVYLIHPRHRIEKEPEADVVLIHGLLGGAFHSWRQQESDSIAVANFTECWPETWLPRDLSNVRILSVEYDTHLSDWMPHCPHEKQTRTISYRSQEILEKLKLAGVGEKRPVIWLAHSMGGLVLKNMMLIAESQEERYKELLNNSKGIIFYSTPHFGSQLAEYSRKVRKLLFPSIEVMALSHDSPQLLYLNDSFKQLVSNYSIKVLSFGELQSTNIGFGNLKIHIVPPKSADPGIGSLILMDTDHLNVCKPISRHSGVYLNTVDFIQACLAESDERDFCTDIEEFIDEVADILT
ncbi:protein SERAC1-like isoform X1 [Styela clava]